MEKDISANPRSYEGSKKRQSNNDETKLFDRPVNSQSNQQRSSYSKDDELSSDGSSPRSKNNSAKRYEDNYTSKNNRTVTNGLPPIEDRKPERSNATLISQGPKQWGSLARKSMRRLHEAGDDTAASAEAKKERDLYKAQKQQEWEERVRIAEENGTEVERPERPKKTKPIQKPSPKNTIRPSRSSYGSNLSGVATPKDEEKRKPIKRTSQRLEEQIFSSDQTIMNHDLFDNDQVYDDLEIIEPYSPHDKKYNQEFSGSDNEFATTPNDLRIEFEQAVGSIKAEVLEKRLADTARAFRRERYDEAYRLIKKLVEQAPGIPAVRELHGLILYRQEKWLMAIKELELFRQMTGSYEQHPVLMDCYRAKKNWVQVATLWDNLKFASPSAELMSEGRIVMAGALSDKGDLTAAVMLLEKGFRLPKNPQTHHLRRGYVLADSYERSGNIPRARELFLWIASVDQDFADVRQRCRHLR